MPLELTKVKVFEKVPGTTHEMRLIATNPYVRIMGQDWPAPVYVQGGKFYGEGGPELDALPAGLEAELDKLSPAVRAEVGLKDTPSRPTQPALPKPDAMWTCPDAAACGQKMPISIRKKGIHVARFHRRRVEPAGSV